MKTEESEQKPNATRVSALDMILEALWKISVFFSDFLLGFIRQPGYSLREDGEYVVPPQRQFRDFLVSNLNLNHPLEGNDVHELFVSVLELLPRWRSEEEGTLHSKFESLAKYFSFEEILKAISLKQTCDKEGCEKQNYVPRMIINNLPSVFAIGLEWEENETEGEIMDTTSVLKTEIDISQIYLYEGGSAFTKYHLVSMVIGDWNNVVSVFAAQKIRPTILFYENVMGRSQILGNTELGTFGEGSKD
ncbi:unnamed protein product [Microthlaspi erraticum]|uniref:Peptidase C19 ubiquitin carboxyl-terminal hydrolase domain-containing protein n=1 Tax=Microthlaspi erraticum TaxID=1685480 RepID=A0A6D2KRT6_9BRAS|nr:unnamed protein product [Microthlaspi erraticum]